MALQKLVATDCGGMNPLLKLSTHVLQDKALQQEGYGKRSTNSLFQSHKSSIPLSSDQQMVEEFMHEQTSAGLVPASLAAPQTFHMGTLLQEIKDMEQASSSVYVQPPDPSIEVIQDLTADEWSEEFLASNPPVPPTTQKSVLEETSPVPPDWKEENFSEPTPLPSFDQNTDSSYDLRDEIIHQDLAPPIIPLSTKFSQNELKQLFQPLIDMNLMREARELCEVTQDNPELQNTNFMKYMRELGGVDDSSLDDEQKRRLLQWRRPGNIEKYLKKSKKPEALHQDLSSSGKKANIETDRLASELHETKTKTRQQLDEIDFWAKLQKGWEDILVKKEPDNPWLPDFESFFEPYKDYTFAEENPFLNHKDPFEEGLKKLKENDIPSAVLLFEANVKKNPDHMMGWQYLGTTQAENERDPAAISALKKCLELDPDNLTALMALATSYLNESLHAQVCNTLWQWLSHNPRYRHLVGQHGGLEEELSKSGPTTFSSVVSNERFNQVLTAFLQAARLSPNNPDPDVQCGLGVLFNVSGECSKAADCFKSALSVRPNDSLLWNRLGASLANGNRSEEAVTAYHRALELSPGFIRSRFNLGISCINLGAYREAAEHFLTALNLQSQGRGPSGSSPTSDNIWTTLRMVTFLLRKPELSEAIERRDLALLNREFGMDS